MYEVILPDSFKLFDYSIGEYKDIGPGRFIFNKTRIQHPAYGNMIVDVYLMKDTTIGGGDFWFERLAKDLGIKVSEIRDNNELREEEE